ncbi:hypothetical protein pdam_00004191 [Pocillopora damicornis]|uniref:Uncharacterized protein n=1 Tax=Pocillopora damicornis TaxID=46731 RepID=A0A3M6TWU9_POCDA|nr:hypothetical protein pdam_00004191 [Pocillopora damicornis]
MKTGWREVQVTHKGTDTSNGVPTQAATLPLVADINSKELNLFPAKGKKLETKHVKSETRTRAKPKSTSRSSNLAPNNSHQGGLFGKLI